MTIHFTNKPEDMAYLNDWYYANKPEGKKLIRKMILIRLAIIWFLCLACFFFVPSVYSQYLLWEAALATVIISFLLPKRFVAGMRKKIMATYSQPENLRMFGERTLELNGDGIVSVTQMTTSLFKWDAIHEIVTTPTHAFLMLGSVQALIIPRASVQEGNFDAFVAEAQRFHSQVTGKPSTTPLPAR